MSSGKSRVRGDRGPGGRRTVASISANNQTRTASKGRRTAARTTTRAGLAKGKPRAKTPMTDTGVLRIISPEKLLPMLLPAPNTFCHPSALLVRCDADAPDLLYSVDASVSSGEGGTKDTVALNSEDMWQPENFLAGKLAGEIYQPAQPAGSAATTDLQPSIIVLYSSGNAAAAAGGGEAAAAATNANASSANSVPAAEAAVAAGLRASGRIKGGRNSLLRLDGPAAVQKLLELCPYLEVNRFQSECEEGGAFATAIPTFTDVSHDSLWGSTSNWTKVSGEEPVVTVAAPAQQLELLSGAAAGASAGGAGDGSSVRKSAIFLDVDGVLHPLTPKGHPVGADIIDLCDRSDEEMAADARKDASFVTRVLPTEFKRSHMEQLKRIVDATGAEIILSSTWREMPSSYAAVAQQLALYNIPPPTSATPVLVSSSHVPPTYRGKRGVEIMLAMEARPHLDAFVVLDDSDFTLGSDTLTTERFPKLDPEAALTAAKADAAIAILKVPKGHGGGSGSGSGGGSDSSLNVPPLTMYIGNYKAAEDVAGLESRGITHVLTVANNLEDLKPIPKHIAHKLLLVDDDEVDISNAAIVVLGLMSPGVVADEGMSLRDAYTFLWNKRMIVCSRTAHLRRLIALEKKKPSCLLYQLESGRMMFHTRRLAFLSRWLQEHGKKGGAGTGVAGGGGGGGVTRKNSLEIRIAALKAGGGGGGGGGIK
eukprot:gene6623-31198_t